MSDMTSPAGATLANQLLIALPTLAESPFARSVALICQHDSDGAMGVVVNRSSEYTLGEVFQQMGIASDDAALCAQPVLAGGPVHPERGFVLHRAPQKNVVDPATGEPYPDLLVISVPDESAKLALVESDGPFFTIPHFDGYNAVLVQQSRLGEISRVELAEVLTEAWAAVAPARLVS